MPIRRQFVYERHPVRKAPHRRRMQAAAGRAEQAEKTEYDGHNEQLRPAPDNPDKLDALDTPDKKNRTPRNAASGLITFPKITDAGDAAGPAPL